MSAAGFAHRRRLARTRPPTAASPSDDYEPTSRAVRARPTPTAPRAAAPFEAALLGDLWPTYLPHLLNRQDKNTMQHSIETRVPFLDPGVVALALNLPFEARATPERKGLLRDLARARLPRGGWRPREAPRSSASTFVSAYLDGHARPEFLAGGRLREQLGTGRPAVAEPGGPAPGPQRDRPLDDARSGAA